MGDKKVSLAADESRMRQFTKAVLNDLQALEKMLAEGKMEDSALRSGAEQEMFLVDSAMPPAPLVLEIECETDFWLENGLPPVGLDIDPRGELPTVEIMPENFTHTVKRAKTRNALQPRRQRRRLGH